MTSQTPSPQHLPQGPAPQQPGAQVPLGYGPVPPVASPQNPSWFARHKILTGAGAVLAVLVVVGVMTGGNDSGSGTTTPAVSSVQSAAAPAAEGGSTEQVEQSAAPAAPAAQPTQEAAASGITFTGMEKKDVAANAGEPITVDGVTLTATPLVAGDATLGDTICSTVTVQNGSDKAIDVSVVDWSLQDPSGVVSDPGFLGSSNHMQSSSIISGGSLTADICFSGTLGSGEYVLIHKPLFSFSSAREAWVNQL